MECLLPLAKAQLFRGKVIQFEVKCNANREKGRGKERGGGGGVK